MSTPTASTRQRWEWKDNPEIIMPSEMVINTNLKNLMLTNEEISNFAGICIICFVTNYRQLHSHVKRINKYEICKMQFPLPNNIKIMLGSSKLIVDGTGEKINVYI